MNQVVEYFLHINPESLLVRNTGQLEVLHEHPHSSLELHGDFSLNITNSLSGKIFLDEGLKTISPSHDMNADQIAQLAANMRNEDAKKV